MRVSLWDWKSLLEFKVQTEYLFNVFLHKKDYCILRRNENLFKNKNFQQYLRELNFVFLFTCYLISF